MILCSFNGAVLLLQSAEGRDFLDQLLDHGLRLQMQAPALACRPSETNQVTSETRNPIPKAVLLRAGLP